MISHGVLCWLSTVTCFLMCHCCGHDWQTAVRHANLFPLHHVLTDLKMSVRRCGICIDNITGINFDVLLSVHLSIFIVVINQLDAKVFLTVSLLMPLHVSSTTCLSSGGQNCIIQLLVSSHLSQPVHGTATYRCDDTRGCIIKFRPPDYEHMELETSRSMK